MIYISRPVVNAQQLYDWAAAAGITNLVPPDQMHVTQVYSRTPVKDFAPRTDTVVVKRKIMPLGDKGAVVLTIDSPTLQARHAEAMAHGASHDFDGYLPHVTLSYQGDIPDDIAPPTFPLTLGPEVHAPINENWADDMRKDITSSSVHTPTTLGNREEEDPAKNNFRVAKIDESLGLVFGWAVVCKVNGADYYDFNVDYEGPHAGERVPEHIPEGVMTKAALDITTNGVVPGNEMHEGPDRGSYPFLFPMTTDIAKALGITTEKTGLLCAFRPPADILAKYASGEYTGFSIEGKRLAYEEHE